MLLTEMEVREKLADFVDKVVLIYEHTLHRYIRQIEDNILKPGTSSNLFKNKLEMESSATQLETFEDAAKASFACDVLIRALRESGVRFNHSETKKLLDHLYLFKTEPIVVRKILEEAAVRIFGSFECQFVQVTVDGSWRRAMSKVARDAVTRAMSYYKENKNEEFSVGCVTCGIVSGKCKQPGIVRYKQSDLDTTQLFGNVGLTDKIRYYSKKNGNTNTSTLGYRLILQHDNLDEYYEENPQQFTYTYVLDVNEDITVERSQTVEEMTEETDDIDNFIKNLNLCIVDNLELLQQFIKSAKMKFDEIINPGVKYKQTFWFGVMPPLRYFTGRTQQLLYIDNKLKQKTMVVICGLDGVGKTTLAFKYAFNHYKKNNFVISIDASTEKSLQRTFRNVHEKLGLEISYVDGEIKSTKLIIEEVYESVGEESVFIFDNAENFNAIKDFLPLTINSKPAVLVTSSNLSRIDWSSRRLNIEMLLLDSFTDSEAVDFVKGSLKINDSDVEYLTKKLYNFPLALNQAVAYINNNGNKNFADLWLCDENPETILNYPVNEGATIFKIIENIEQKIRQDTQNGQQALDVLKMICYLTPNSISQTIFLNSLAEGSEDRMIDITNLLRNHALVSLSNGFVSINGLVEAAIKLKIKTEKTELKYLQKVLKLLKEKLDDPKDVEIYSPHILTAWKYSQNYNELIKQYIINNKEDSYTSFFHVLVQQNNYEILDSILQKMKKINLNIPTSIVNKKDKEKGTSLHNAAVTGNETIVKLLIENGAKVNTRKRHEWTPLHLATLNGSLSIVQLLLDNNATIDCRTGFKYTPLHLAAKIGRADIVELLLSKGADVNIEANHGETALHFAVKTNRVECVEELLKNEDVDINAETHFRLTPLHFASKGGCVKIVKILLKNHADVNVQNLDGFTALHFAAIYNYLEIVEELLADCNIEINAQTTQGNTPLYLAAEQGNVAIVEALVNKKAKINIVNREDRTAVDVATDQVIKNIFSKVRTSFFW